MRGRIAHGWTIGTVSAVASACAVPPTPLNLGGDSSSSGAPPATGATLDPQSSTNSSASGTSGSTSDPLDPSSSTAASTTDPGGTATTSTGPGGSADSDTGTTTSGAMCGGMLIECAGQCVDPSSDQDYCGANAPCDVDPGTSCHVVDEICLLGACSNCQLRYNFEVGMDAVGSLAGWTPQGTWASYGATPVTSLPSVAFGQTVYGVTGQDNGGNELSQVTMNPVPGGATLSFRSWNVDRGGNNVEGWDNKIIEYYEGGWQTLVDCDLGPNDHLPFCDFVAGPRAADDWDQIVLAVPGWSGPSQLRFRYETNAVQTGSEQGWYIDDIRIGDDCGPPT